MHESEQARMQRAGYLRRAALVAGSADGALAEATDGAGLLTRGMFLTGALGASAAVAVGADEASGQGKLGKGDRAILNYALTLEFLQPAFYTEAERLKALKGDPARAARKLGSVKRAHVKAFRDVLGKKAIGRPSFDFQGVTKKPRAFLKPAVAFEDLAVAAYAGQGARFKADSAVTAAVVWPCGPVREARWFVTNRARWPAPPSQRSMSPRPSSCQTIPTDRSGRSSAGRSPLERHPMQAPAPPRALRSRGLRTRPTCCSSSTANPTNAGASG
jgi:hypothetical protein